MDGLTKYPMLNDTFPRLGQRPAAVATTIASGLYSSNPNLTSIVAYSNYPPATIIDSRI